MRRFDRSISRWLGHVGVVLDLSFILNVGDESGVSGHLVSDCLRASVWQLHGVFAMSFVPIPIFLLPEVLVVVTVGVVVNIIAELIHGLGVRVVIRRIVGSLIC